MKSNRKLIKGVPASPGIAIGHARVILADDIRIPEMIIPAGRCQAEIDSLDKAVAATMAEVRKLRDAASKKASGPIAKIFDAQMMIASDYDFIQQVKEEIVAKRRSAGFVYKQLVEKITHPLRQANDPYMRQMSMEIDAVARKILSKLGTGASDEDIEFPANTILVSQVFTPGQVLTFRDRKAAGFAAAEGGRTSHMALIARSLMIPMVIVEDISDLVPNDAPIIIDGSTGIVVINPNEEDFAEATRLRKRQGPALITQIKKLETIPPKTADGRTMHIAANLELPGPIDAILAEKKICVGLYRTEFLYLREGDYPDEETQYQVYAQIAETFAHCKVILRTYDIGSDKMKEDGEFGHEDNPALGWRGIRSMLEMPDIFKAQIRAMLRASARKNLKVMLPMISDLSEYERARKLIQQVMLELKRARVPFDPEIPVGIMVEVPSAALTADLLARKVDFISIGTNDLTQYTMSADRANARVANLYNSYHPSVLQLIKMTVEACKKHRKPVSICGEIAGDQLALPLFIGLGVEQLSMNPAKIYDLCRLVGKIDTAVARHLVESVMNCPSAAAVTRRLESFREALEK
ncbi:MAG: phosphoenolpyruvate--protein phosphotransferase [bacterium]|nr:phosphoenolpyruvate--protein phosphotransferase [bacterium]